MSSSVTAPTNVGRFPWLFFGCAFGITWAVWVPFAIMNQIWGTPPSGLLNLGAFGPSIAGIIMTYLNPDKRVRRDFWRRLSFRRLTIGGYLFVFLAIPGLYLAAVLVDCLTHGASVSFPYYSRILSSFETAIPMLVFLIVVGPLTEELGWRGFALDRLQEKWSPLVSAVVLGIIWGAWHFPLFFIKGTVHGDWGIGSLYSLVFLPFHISLSVLMSWLYNRNRRSTISAILLHFTSNTSSNLLPATATAFPLAVCLFGVTAVAVIAFGGMKRTGLRES